MGMRKIGFRLSKKLRGLISVLVPVMSSTAQAGQNAGQAPMTTAPQPSGLSAAVALEDRAAELITTTGQATVVRKPDALRAELGVEVRGRLLTQARDELATKIERLTQAMKALGRDKLMLQTSDLRITPIYDEPKEGKLPRIVGYRARNTFTITLVDVDPAKVGAEAATILDAGVTAGANVVEGVSFFLTQPERARARALELAITDAENNAKVMATSAGLRLGQVHDVNGSPERPIPIMFSDELALRAMPKIEPGDVSITASVSIRYHFTRP
jgi:uncharacterized protein YggE